MAAFVFIHGAEMSAGWDLVAAGLREQSHGTTALDLPCEDDSAGLAEYAGTVAPAASDRTGLVAVTQSLGVFTAPLVGDRVPVEQLILVALMIDAPSEALAGYWLDRGYEEEVRERHDGDIALFDEDVPPELATEAPRWAHPRAEPPTQTGGSLYGIRRRAGTDFCRAPTWPSLTAGCWP